MPFFSFKKNSSRAQVAVKKPVIIGPFLECCPPTDVKNGIQLITLAQARESRKVRLRTVIDSPEMVAEVGIWEDIYEPSPQSEDELVQDTDSEYSSSSSSEADSSLAPEILDYYVCHKPYEYTPEDDSMLDVDQSALFAELEDMLTEPVVEKKEIPAKETVRVVEPVQTKTTKQAKRGRFIRPEDTLIPLHVAMNRPDIRYRPEGFEMF